MWVTGFLLLLLLLALWPGFFVARWLVREPVFIETAARPQFHGPDWHVVLGVAMNETSLDEIKRNYRRKAQSLHPDRGGSAQAMAELNRAYQMARAELESV